MGLLMVDPVLPVPWCFAQQPVELVRLTGDLEYIRVGPGVRGQQDHDGPNPLPLTGFVS